MRRPTPAELNARIEDERIGVKYVKELEPAGCLSSSSCFSRPMKSNPIKSIFSSDHSGNLVWSENARFHFFDRQSGDASKTPRNRLRWTIKCMVPEQINNEEYLWTGHTSGEVCLWTELGRLVGKPFTVAKTGITAMCLVSPRVLWIGGASGNIRVIKLDTSQTPFEIRFHTTVVPGLETASRTLTSRTWIRPMRSGPSLGSIENIPEDFEVSLGAERSSGVAVAPSEGSFIVRVKEKAHNTLRSNRAHSSHVRCIFSKAGHVWTAGGRMFSSIKLWGEADHRLEEVFMLHARGPCTTMVSIPWQAPSNSSQGTGHDWRLLTAHDSGLMYLWDPMTKPFKPLLEIETRKSPIKSMVIFERLGLMCTAHRDGSVLVGRILSHQMRIPGLTASGTDDDDQIYPFVPRTLCEDVFPGGLQCAVPGRDCLFIVSTRGEILYWPKEKLTAHFNLLKRSSSRRMPVQVVNESVMVIDSSKVILGETIYDGDFARVKRGKFLAKEVIIKEAKDANVSRRAMDALVKDAHILSTIRHPNIVNIMAVCDDPPFVVMQYYEEGSLYDVLKRCRREERVAARFSWLKRLSVAIDICCGMIFLHSQKPSILHRDLKSPNVFIEKDFSGASVGDFNLSKDTEPTVLSGSVRPSNPMWLAPEVAKGASDFSIAADIYSFGILLWEIATARTPWDHLKTGKGSGREIFFGRIRYELFDNRRPQLSRNENGDLMNISGGSFPQIEAYTALMQDCWAGNPEDRPESFEVVVGRLEIIKKQLQDWRTTNHLSKIATSVKKAPVETEEITVKQTSSEPENVSKVAHKDLPPKHPIAKPPYVDNIPQSPFDRKSAEEQQEKGQDTPPAGDTGGALPVSPFN